VIECPRRELETTRRERPTDAVDDGARETASAGHARDEDEEALSAPRHLD
jgi:hypothetical protein